MTGTDVQNQSIESRELRESRESRRPFLGISVLVLLGAAVASVPPVAFILVNSFNSADPSEAYQFGFQGWERAFANEHTIRSIGYSFLLNIRTFIGIAFAFLFCWLLIRVRIPFKGFIELSLWIAYFLPSLPLAISWILLLDPNYGLLNQVFGSWGFKLTPYSIYGIMWVHLTASTIPVMTILLAPAFRQLESSLEEAARTCGAGTWRTFRHVLIPVLGPALFTVWLAGMIRGLESFQVELLLGKPVGIEVFATRIYDLIEWEPPEFSQAITLSTFFLVVLFVLAMIYQSYTKDRHYVTVSGKGANFRPIDLGIARYFISAALLVFIGLAVFLPVGALVLGSSMRIFGYFEISNPYTLDHWRAVVEDPVFLSSVRNSLVLGLSTGGLALLVYCLLGYALIRLPLTGKSLANVFIWLPWAVPGIIMSLGFLWIFLSVPILSPLYGTIISLIWVLIIKELPIGVHLIKASFTQLSEDLEQVARVCGSKWWYSFRRITLPLISPTLVAIFVIVFMASIRDVDNVLLLANASTRPLALLMMEYALGGQMESASIVSVILASFAIVVAIVVRKFGYRMQS